MEIKTAADLKAAIALHEVDVSVKKKILTDQYQATVESLKPANIVRNTLENVKDGLGNMFKTGDLAEKLIGAAVGFGTGFLTKRLVLGKSPNKFKRILGTALELGLTSVLSKNATVIKEKGVNLWNRFRHKNNVEEKIKIQN